MAAIASATVTKEVTLVEALAQTKPLSDNSKLKTFLESRVAAAAESIEGTFDKTLFLRASKEKFNNPEFQKCLQALIQAKVPRFARGVFNWMITPTKDNVGLMTDLKVVDLNTVELIMPYKEKPDITLRIALNPEQGGNITIKLQDYSSYFLRPLRGLTIDLENIDHFRQLMIPLQN